MGVKKVLIITYNEPTIIPMAAALPDKHDFADHLLTIACVYVVGSCS
jgi:hypothetical protein